MFMIFFDMVVGILYFEGSKVANICQNIRPILYCAFKCYCKKVNVPFDYQISKSLLICFRDKIFYYKQMGSCGFNRLSIFINFMFFSSVFFS